MDSVGGRVEEFLNNPTLRLGIELLESVFTRQSVDIWLNTPQEMLENKTPQSLIDNGCEKIVLNLIADMLTGNPM